MIIDKKYQEGQYPTSPPIHQHFFSVDTRDLDSLVILQHTFCSAFLSIYQPVNSHNTEEPASPTNSPKWAFSQKPKCKSSSSLLLSLPRIPRLIHVFALPPPPRKRKLQQDPNNTKWTRNENTFGQKILRAQGWQPGQYLGAQDAPHSELHTAANASYIRVSLKDDMKGLGFDKAVKDDEVTGLDVFNDLLSRLNGKSEAAVEEEKRARLVVKTHRFVEQRYGAMRFVRGGLLVGDELKADDNLAKKEDEEERKEEEGEKKASKKRKATSLEEGEDESASAAEPESKKKRKREEKKSSKKRSADVSNDEAPTETDSKAKRKDKKSKKDKSAKSEAEDDVDMDEAPKQSTSIEQSDDSGPSSKPKKSKEERKEEKRLKKLKKEEKKEAKRRKKAEAKASSKSTSPEPSTTEEATTSEATPAGSGTSTPRTNPHFVRSRFLKAKREAMDTNAINKVRETPLKPSAPQRL